MERKQIKKLRQTKGESITEAMVSMILIAMIFSFLAEAVVAPGSRDRIVANSRAHSIIHESLPLDPTAR